jgi:hypothetical protein
MKQRFTKWVLSLVAFIITGTKYTDRKSRFLDRLMLAAERQPDDSEGSTI